ncbi:MAG TPA: hypothetical protein PLF48_09625 [Chitinophagales bacterium]|nr:hypothetical protein [Chitinophagales bacterium]
MTIKDDIILKIQNSDDVQLLAEVFRILKADEYVFSDEEIASFYVADTAIDEGRYIDNELLNSKVKAWINQKR